MQAAELCHVCAAVFHRLIASHLADRLADQRGGAVRRSDAADPHRAAVHGPTAVAMVQPSAAKMLKAKRPKVSRKPSQVLRMFQPKLRTPFPKLQSKKAKLLPKARVLERRLITH